MAVAGNSGRSLPNRPHQPLTFPFPKREFGEKWFVREASKFCGLVNGYIKDENVVLCYTCARA